MPEGGQVTIDAMNLDMDNLPADWQDVPDLAELLPGRYVAFRITDTGTGMDTATAERAFDPFFTTKSEDRAAGLGLPTVRRFAAQVGGKAWLRSELGSGTTITVVLPAAPGSGSPGAAQAGRASELSQVLVVDDEAAADAGASELPNASELPQQRARSEPSQPAHRAQAERW
jgi:hypothetical protein